MPAKKLVDMRFQMVQQTDSTKRKIRVYVPTDANVSKAGDQEADD